jgi:hypothetical protein
MTKLLFVVLFLPMIWTLPMDIRDEESLDKFQQLQSQINRQAVQQDLMQDKIQQLNMKVSLIEKELQDERTRQEIDRLSFSELKSEFKELVKIYQSLELKEKNALEEESRKNGWSLSTVMSMAKKSGNMILNSGGWVFLIFNLMKEAGVNVPQVWKSCSNAVVGAVGACGTLFPKDK